MTNKTNDTGHLIEVHPGAQRIQVEIAGELIADSRRSLVLEETRCPTRYYLPREDVRLDRLERTTTHTHCPYKGDASYWTARVGDRVVADAAWSYEDPLPAREDIRGYLCFYPSRVDRFLIDGQPMARG
jgi:uncharacterized protein (DUF427 family)